ncbi:uncharacterized protein FIBRA_09544 [Fibroporia radiculosa]|uniref:Uncharacterized protein n=1 Tax=Fibroporia radiculosa TaxID=599839 RepID=J7SD58_9APHY|nr:uncharacterized protein FIBRA_09544 [Fibroporia radiculosa]CCM07203.1 predicted protein [Fibroporia radiculosa]
MDLIEAKELLCLDLVTTAGCPTAVEATVACCDQELEFNWN